MKRILGLWLPALCLGCTLLTACGGNAAEQKSTIATTTTTTITTATTTQTPTHQHIFGEWTETKSATCTSAGEKEHVCTECGAKESETIAKLAHTFGEWIETKAATCTTVGAKERVCAVCGGSKETEPIAKAEHNYQNKVCSGCGELKSSDGLQFELTNNTYTVIGIGTCSDVDIVIPSTHLGKSVTAIGTGAFRECTKLTSITIPGSVTSIGDSAFANCKKLTHIIFAERDNSTKLTIGTMAFLYCSSLRTISLPAGLEAIGDFAFHLCENLISITIPQSVTFVGEGALSSCSKLNVICCEAESKPDGWHDYWNLDSLPVYWGVPGDDSDGLK